MSLDSETDARAMGKHVLCSNDGKTIYVAEADINEYLRKTQELRDAGQLPLYCLYRDLRHYEGKGHNEDKCRVAVALWWAESLLKTIHGLNGTIDFLTDRLEFPDGFDSNGEREAMARADIEDEIDEAVLAARVEAYSKAYARGLEVGHRVGFQDGFKEAERQRVEDERAKS